MVKLIAVVGLALTALVSCGHHTKMAQYQDPRDGWTISYPLSMYRTAAERAEGMTSWRGVLVANSKRVRASDPTYFRKFPPDGVAFGLFQFGGGPAPDLSPPEARFPLSRSDFAPVHGTPPPTPLIHGMIANGERWLVFVSFGPKASHADKEKTWRIVESIRFPPQRTGTMSGYFYVLEDASRYPLGAVAGFPGKDFPQASFSVPPFFLVHAPKGLYAVSWQPKFEPKCHMAFDQSRVQFFCKAHRGRWDRMGDVIESPDSDLQYNDALDLGQAKIGRNGQVLVGNWIGGGHYARYARRFWPPK